MDDNIEDQLLSELEELVSTIENEPWDEEHACQEDYAWAGGVDYVLEKLKTLITHHKQINS